MLMINDYGKHDSDGISVTYYVLLINFDHYGYTTS
jgi:hypothetical protein